jgi:hypothetical protein
MTKFTPDELDTFRRYVFCEDYDFEARYIAVINAVLDGEIDGAEGANMMLVLGCEV